MYKKAEAGDFVSFFPFIFLLLIIGGGVVAEVYVFFGSGYDFRQTDAEILGYKIEKCLSSESGDFSGEEIYSKCGIDAKSLEGSLMNFKICRISEDCYTSGSPIIFSGGSFESCKLTGARENSNYVRCSERISRLNGEEVTILTASNQHIKTRGLNE